MEETIEDQVNTWAEYKKQKAVAFVNAGYSVEWGPEPDHIWMRVYKPQLRAPQQRGGDKLELSGSVLFSSKPTGVGINGGRVYKLCIQRRKRDLFAEALGKPGVTADLLFSYERGEDVNRLKKNPEAQTLYDIIIRELN